MSRRILTAMITTALVGAIGVGVASASTAATPAATPDATAPTRAESGHVKELSTWRFHAMTFKNSTSHSIQVGGHGFFDPGKEMRAYWNARDAVTTTVEGRMPKPWSIEVVSDNPFWSESSVKVNGHEFFGNGQVDVDGIRVHVEWRGDTETHKEWRTTFHELPSAR